MGTYLFIIKASLWIFCLKYIDDCKIKEFVVWAIVIGLFFPIIDLISFDLSGLQIFASFLLYPLMSTPILYLAWNSNGIFVTLISTALGAVVVIVGIPLIIGNI